MHKCYTQKSGAKNYKSEKNQLLERTTQYGNEKIHIHMREKTRTKLSAYHISTGKTKTTISEEKETDDKKKEDRVI